MDPEMMDILFDLYKGSNSVKTADYENTYRNIFFNKEIFMKEADMMIQNYNLQIEHLKIKQLKIEQLWVKLNDIY